MEMVLAAAIGRSLRVQSILTALQNYNRKSQCSLTTGLPQLLWRSLRMSLKPAFS